MTPQDYEKEVRRARPEFTNTQSAIAYHARQLRDPAGELARLAKQNGFQELHPLIRDRLVEIAGDVLVQVVSILTRIGETIISAQQIASEFNEGRYTVPGCSPLHRPPANKYGRLTRHADGLQGFANDALKEKEEEANEVRLVFLRGGAASALYDLTEVIGALDISLEEVMAASAAKLRALFPEQHE